MIEFKNTRDKWDFLNFFDIGNNFFYILFYFYRSHRHLGLAYAYLPQDYKEGDPEALELANQAITSLMTVGILTGILIKSMDLVQFNKDMGKLVKLVFAVLNDVQVLFVFLVLNICLFALFYMSLGYKLSDELNVET